MNFIKSIKEGLKNPKTKSLTMLGIYFVFFLFVFILLNSAENKNNEPIIEEKEKSTIDNYQTMESYQYKFNYINNGLSNIIEGTYFKDTTLFNYNNNKYYFENDLIYIINNDSYSLGNIEHNITKLFSKNLYNILVDLKEVSTTTYNDGTKEINYVMDSNKFYNYYYENISNYQNNIGVKIVKKDNNINSIIFDLTNLNISLSRIEIEYYNINNISNLEFNKDNYTYRE